MSYKWMEVATKEIGVTQEPGPKSNSRINEYLKSVGIGPDDEISWCSAFVNWCLSSVGITGTEKANAKSWLEWGEESGPVKGAVCVLWREDPKSWKGHVGFFDGFDGTNVVLLGGNQGDRVCLAKYPNVRVLGYRMPVGFAEKQKPPSLEDRVARMETYLKSLGAKL